MLVLPQGPPPRWEDSGSPYKIKQWLRAVTDKPPEKVTVTLSFSDGYGSLRYDFELHKFDDLESCYVGVGRASCAEYEQISVTRLNSPTLESSTFDDAAPRRRFLDLGNLPSQEDESQ